LISARVVPRTEQRPESEQITLLSDSGEFRNLDLGAAASVRFVDPDVQRQFQEYLAALTSARSRDSRSVYLDSTGTQTREIIADYMIPMPVWKSTYRLIWGPAGEPTLEGWAIVDNTTGEDWSNVQLSLVSGKPISFISRLYEPRYIQRPTAELPEERAQAPVLYQGAIGGALGGNATIVGTVRDASGAVIPGATIKITNMETGSTQTIRADSRGSYSARVAPGTYEVSAEMPGFQSDVMTDIEANAAEPATADFTLEVGGVTETVAVSRAMAAPLRQERMRVADRALAPSTLTATAAAQELGELFEYRFPNAVTVHRNESAMLPFLQEKIGARKLLVYSDPGAVHPMNSAELTNSTGKTLDGGPITVYDDNAYAGEALMETLKTGDKRLISYGVDLGTRITTQFDSKGNIVREVHLRRGVLTSRTAAVETKTYTIRNVDQKPKTLIIEHPVRSEYKVTDQKPVETTANAYRFEVKLAAGATEKFPVTEEHVFDSTVAISNITPDQMTTFLQNKSLSDAARAQLQQILDKKRQIAEGDGEIRRTEAQINSLFQDQERLRQNINSLNRVSGQEPQVQTYARQLSAQEGQLASLRDRLAQLQRNKAALESELNSLLEKMEF
jgi:hypothetical protein